MVNVEKGLTNTTAQVETAEQKNVRMSEDNDLGEYSKKKEDEK